jgi:hypothetical protein
MNETRKHNPYCGLEVSHDGLCNDALEPTEEEIIVAAMNRERERGRREAIAECAAHVCMWCQERSKRDEAPDPH